MLGKPVHPARLPVGRESSKDALGFCRAEVQRVHCRLQTYPGRSTHIWCEISSSGLRRHIGYSGGETRCPQGPLTALAQTGLRMSAPPLVSFLNVRPQWMAFLSSQILQVLSLALGRNLTHRRDTLALSKSPSSRPVPPGARRFPLGLPTAPTDLPTNPGLPWSRRYGAATFFSVTKPPRKPSAAPHCSWDTEQCAPLGLQDTVGLTPLGCWGLSLPASFLTAPLPRGLFGLIFAPLLTQ